MKRRDSKVLYTPGYRMADIEFFDEATASARRNHKREPVKSQPAKKIAAEPVKVEPPKNRRGRGARTRGNRRGRERKRAFKEHLKELARIVAQDLLELRIQANEEAIERWREQQAAESKRDVELFTALFHKQVMKEAERLAAGKAA